MTGTSWHVTAKSSIRKWVMLYKSGVYALTVTSPLVKPGAGLTPGGLPYALTSRLRLNVGLRGEQSLLTVWQKSAEGIVGTLSFSGMDDVKRPFPGNRWYDGHQPEAMRRCTEGLNGMADK